MSSTNTRRYLLRLEALLCFGPLAIIVAFGVIMLPMWVWMLGGYFLGQPHINYSGAPMPWSALFPIILVVCGSLGLAGLIRVLTVITDPAEHAMVNRTTIGMVAAGIAGLVLFWFQVGGVPLDLSTALFVYCILPVVGSSHFIYLARKRFGGTTAP